MPKVYNLPTVTSMDNSDYLLMEGSSGGTKKITRANALSPIGTIISTANTTVSIPNGTPTNVCQITLTAGVWVISAQATISGGNATGRMSSSISTQSGTLQAWSRGGYTSIPITYTDYLAVNLSKIVSITTSQTYYLVISQSSGATKTSDADACYLGAVRIK